MHYKFLRHSKGSGRAAIEYLLGDLDHQGRPRELIQVLRGDPYQLGRLIDSMQRVHRYTSGVIALHPSDKYTPEDIEAMIRDFERITFAGLDPDEYSYCIVQHDDHFHIIIAQVHLPSGKRLNVAPPGWQKQYDTWRDYWNWKMRWARPDDPARARDVQPGRMIRTNEWADGDIRQKLAYGVTRAIQSGEIAGNRAGVLEWLGKQGEIHRATKTSISIRFLGDKKNVRLQGRLFHQDFDGLSRADLEEQRRELEARREQLAEQARIRFEETVERRAASVTQDWQKTRKEVDEQRRRQFELLERERREWEEREAAERAGHDNRADEAGADPGEPAESAPLGATGDGLQGVRARDCSSRVWRNREWRKPIGPLRQAARVGPGRGAHQQSHHSMQQPAADRVAAAGPGTGGLTDEQRRSIDAAIGAAVRSAESADRALSRAGDAASSADRAIERAPERDAQQRGVGRIRQTIAGILELVDRAKRDLIEWLRLLPDSDSEAEGERPGG